MSIILALALFGCSDDGTYCRRIEGPSETYASQAQCEAASGGAIDKAVTGVDDYPTIVAQCLPAATLASFGDRAVDLTKRPFHIARGYD
jgi:hypothetical protein